MRCRGGTLFHQEVIGMLDHWVLLSRLGRSDAYRTGFLIRDASTLALAAAGKAFALTLYRGAGMELESLSDIARRVASYRSHSALLVSDGIVTVSPMSRPTSAASTMSSA